MRRILNKIFSSRVFFVIFALLAAIALLIYVEITENELHTRTVNNISIEFSNRDIFRDAGLWISYQTPEELSITFEAPLNILNQLDRDSVFANVDLSNVTSTGQIAVNYNIIFPDGITENDVSMTRNYQQVTLLVDRMSVRSVPVQVVYTGGTASEDLVEMPHEFEPQSVIVEGPEELLARIGYARVSVMRVNLATTFVDDLGFHFVDTYEDELSEDELGALSADVETINVTIPIRMVRDIPLDVTLIHGAGSSDENTSLTITPQVITVLGPPETVRDLPPINLGTIPTASFTNIFSDQLRIILPSQITSESREEYASVRVDVHNLDVVDFQVENLFVHHAPPEYYVQIIPSHINVRLRGRVEDLEHVTAMNIRLVADFRELDIEVGQRYWAPARVYIDGIDADIGAIGDYTIHIRLLAEAP